MPDEDRNQEKASPVADEAGSGKAGGWLIAAGVIVGLVCLVWACALVTRFIGNPMAMPSVLVVALLVVGFQVGFTLCACGLAAIGRRAVYVFLPVVLCGAVVVGAVSGFVSYLAASGVPDLAYLKPTEKALKAAWGWELEQEKSSLRHVSVTYVQPAGGGGRSMRSTMTISVPRRRTGPMSTEAWQGLIASVSKEPKSVGLLERTQRETKPMKISGQRAFKVVDTMRGGRGPGFVQARYWWYSPKLQRLMTCVAAVDGSSTWKLDAIEKMLNSVPVQ